MGELASALVMWAAGDRTTLLVEQAGTTAVTTAKRMMAQLDVIATAVDEEIRARRDAAYRMDVVSRYDRSMERLKNGRGPHTPDTDAAFLDEFSDVATGTGPYEAEVPRNDLPTGAQSHCISSRCMGWCLLDADGRSCDQISHDPTEAEQPQLGGNPS